MPRSALLPTFFAKLAALLALAIVLCTAARSHEVRPAVVTLSLLPENRYELSIVANLEALMTGIGDRHKDTDDAPEARSYNQLRALSAADLRARFDQFAPRWLDGVGLAFDGTRQALRIARLDVPDVGDLKFARVSTIRLDGAIPPGTKSFRWSYAAEFGSSVLRLKRPGEALSEQGWLRDGAPSAEIQLADGAERSRAERMAEYVTLGFTHILPKGLDHILFVLGLYFLGNGWRPLLVQVTAFTVAHSITLALGLYGVVRLSPAIVEPLIALSILYVAVENMIARGLTPWRPFVVFGFGLLHGLGFAGILSELELPRADYLLGLLGFNLGVELGQLAVIALAWLGTGLVFGARPWYRARVAVPASLVIAAFGLYWTIERVFFAA